MTRFILALHCHQPVGNFPWVLEEAYAICYRPFVDVLEKHPSIPVVFHYSGFLLDWFQKEQPDFLKRLKALVKRGQAEFLGGGYYEPILPVIPPADARGQLAQMNRTLERLGLVSHSQKTRGIWLAERVWEPALPSLLAESQVDFTVVDDHHLALAGVPEPNRFGYYLTEDQGLSLALFPCSKALRYHVPFKPVEEVVKLLRSFSSEQARVVVLADDGEKFGMWPGTHKWVYEEGWLDSFFSALEQNQSWLKMSTFSQALEELPPLGRVYLPTASYEEMGEWSGGTFRNFFNRYPESDAMHKKMLALSGRVREARAGAKTAKAKKVVGQAEQALYRAQSNDAYWHGVFGGLYLRHLRRSVYANLIEGDRALDQLEKKKSWVRVEWRDGDADRVAEVLLTSDQSSLFVDANGGGQILEWSDKATNLNFLDTLTRRPEAYHQRVHAMAGANADGGAPATIHHQGRAHEAEFEDHLIYDPYRRAGWVDHFYALDETVQAFARGGAREWGDFLAGAYHPEIRRSAKKAEVVLTREGGVGPADDRQSVRVVKKIAIAPAQRAVNFSYRVTNLSPRPLQVLFGCEANWNLKDAHVNRVGEAQGILRFSVSDSSVRMGVRWVLSQEARLWHFPIETISDSEKGMERTYQGVNLTFLWPIHLNPRASWDLQGTAELESLHGKP